MLKRELGREERDSPVVPVPVSRLTSLVAVLDLLAQSVIALSLANVATGTSIVARQAEAEHDVLVVGQVVTLDAHLTLIVGSL